MKIQDTTKIIPKNSSMNTVLQTISTPTSNLKGAFFTGSHQRNTYRVLQTIQIKLTLLCVWAERAVLGRAKTALKFKYEI